MKYFLIQIFLFVAASKAHKILKCGYVSDKCVPLMDTNRCPKFPLCPFEFKRIETDEGCCCVSKVLLAQKDSSQNFNSAKSGILTKAVNDIGNQLSFVKFKITSENLKYTEALSAIDDASKLINEIIFDGLIELGKLIETDYESILPFVFGDSIDASDKINQILVEAKEIYSKAQNVFENFKEILESLNVLSQ